MVKAMEEQWKEMKINYSMLSCHTNMMHPYTNSINMIYITPTPTLQSRNLRSYNSEVKGGGGFEDCCLFIYK